MRYTPSDIGKMIRLTRKGMGLTQEMVAIAAGTGVTFLIDLEKGKPTCELQKTLAVLNALGITLAFSSPVPAANKLFSES